MRSITYQYPNPNGSGPDYPPLNAEFRFALPIEVGDTGLEVQVIKFFLGMGGIHRTGPEFDAVTAAKVSDWQRSNRDRIKNIIGAGDSAPGLEPVGEAATFAEEIKTIQQKANYESGFNLTEERQKLRDIEIRATEALDGLGPLNSSINVTSKGELLEACENNIRKLRRNKNPTYLKSKN